MYGTLHRNRPTKPNQNEHIYDEMFSHKKKWNVGIVQVHVDPPSIKRIKSNNDEKPDNYCIKIKFHRDPTSQKSDPYEFKMALFDNGEPEEFLMFIRNFNTNLMA